MNEHDATEQIYKNGFEDGRKSVLKLGKWKTLYDNMDGKIIGWVHEECGMIHFNASKYCPDCGAKMSVETEEGTWNL